ncbi:carotenoid oxygenase family protein [soil metagenome]
MSDFSDFPLKGYFAPARFEAEVFDCEVKGEIPKELSGAFYRMHGDWFYPPFRQDEASLSADGYISMFRFQDGIVDYRGRYVRTDRWRRQHAARRQLYGYYRNPYTDDESVRDLEHPTWRTTANTTPVVIGGKLYATKEEGPAYRIDPNTLETIGVEDFDGDWKSETFTAHPKLDPRTGETIAFGYEATGLCSKDVFLYIFDAQGKIRKEHRFEVPYTSAIHDIAITRTHVIFPGSSLVTSVDRLQSGKKHWGWDQTLPAWYGLVNRETGDTRFFFGPQRSLVHTANAWDGDDGKIVMDLPAADGNTWPFFEDVHGAAFEMSPNTIRRLTFDLRSNSDQVHEDVLFDQEVTSFTRIDERFTGDENRYIFVQYADRNQPFGASLPADEGRTQPNNSFGRFDLKDFSITSCWAGPHHMVQEPVFIPRQGSTAEGDGYLIGTVHNLLEHRAELMIMDAVTMTEVGRVLLPFRNALQVHGAWASEDMLPFDA